VTCRSQTGSCGDGTRRSDREPSLVNGSCRAGLFGDTTAFIELSTAVLLVGTVAAVVLLMRRRHVPAPVVD
jgi:hypothetical protein